MEIKGDKVRSVWVEASKSRHNMLKPTKEGEDPLKISCSNISLELSEDNKKTDKDTRQNTAHSSKKQICNLNSRSSKRKLPQGFRKYEYNPSTLPKYFWYLISITSIITSDVNLDVGGTDFELSTFDILTMTASIYLLMKSFDKNKPLLAIPWIVSFLWSLYTCQYLSLVQIMRTNAYTETNVNILTWLAYGLAVSNIGLRFVLWCKVLDFLFGTELLCFISYWCNIIGYMSRRITTVRTMIPKNLK